MVNSDELTDFMRPGALRELVAVAKGGEQPAPSEPQNARHSKERHGNIIFRETCHYCISKTAILGTLTLTCESLTFEPDYRDANVDERGCSYYQVHLDLVNIAECALIGVSTDDIDLYEQGSIHCNGMLQILLKSGQKNASSRPDNSEAQELSCSSGEFKYDNIPDEDKELPLSARTVGFVSQGISKLTSVVNMAPFGRSSRSKQGSSRATSAASTPRSTFIVFGFFTKVVAHNCTLALMDALDEAKKRELESPSRYGIFSVPFSSNALLDLMTANPASEQSDDSFPSSSTPIASAMESYRGFPAGDLDLTPVVETDKHLRNRVEENSKVLTADMVGQLMEYLPPALAIRDWELSFETRHDGISFLTLYKNLEGHDHCLLVIKDDKGGVFGAFTGPIALSYKFYGTSETFVFKFVEGRLRVYRAKGSNRCYVYSSENSIVIGGGTDSAITIDDSFRTGTSATSDTFGNEPLSESLFFNIYAMEVWTFGNYLT